MEGQTSRSLTYFVFHFLLEASNKVRAFKYYGAD